LLHFAAAWVLAAIVSASPFQIVDDIPVVNVFVNGKGPFSFAVDTGATWTILTPELANQLKLKPVGFRPVSGAGPNGMQAVNVRLKSLRVGQAAASDMEAYVVPLAPRLFSPPGHGHVYGLLGEGFFHRYVTVIDYETSELAFYGLGGYTPPHSGFALPMTLVSGAMVPAVPVSIDADTAVFMLDTGDGGWPNVTAAFAKKNINHRYPTGKDQAAQGEGGAYAMRTICLDHFAIAGVDFRNVPMYVQSADYGITAEGDFQGAIGYEILRHFAVALDFARSTVYLTPNADSLAYDHCATAS
jgi:hypothetical protein